MPAVIAASMVRNEGDIIEAFIRHNASYVDHFVIIENFSSDATAAILKSLIAEGFSIEMAENRDLSYQQAGTMNAIARSLAGRPDISHLVLLDADEFIGGSPVDFRAGLAAEPDRNWTLRWVNYVPLPGDDKTEINPLRRIRHRFNREAAFKIIVPQADFAESVISTGNHTLQRNGALVEQRMMPSNFLAHFPIRSKEQLLSKTIIGSWSMMLRQERGRNENGHWATMSNLISSLYENDHDIEQFHILKYYETYSCEITSGLIEDPFISPAEFSLKYTSSKVNVIRNMKFFVDYVLENQR